jgi:pimeloyl-ACP methyl ester carboxylesterase
MAHSWGSFIGIRVAARAPELYDAYIGVAQVVNTAESERLAYGYMLKAYAAAENKGILRRLKAYPVSESEAGLRSFFISALRDRAMHSLGIGTMRDMKSVITGIFLPVMRCGTYTLKERTNIWRAKAFLRSKTVLLDELLSDDANVTVPQLEIPAYFLSGGYDLTVNAGLSRAYARRLKAPVKGFYTFTESAHSPMFEQPEAFMKIMTGDVIGKTAALADEE